VQTLASLVWRQRKLGSQRGLPGTSLRVSSESWFCGCSARAFGLAALSGPAAQSPPSSGGPSPNRPGGRRGLVAEGAALPQGATPKRETRTGWLGFRQMADKKMGRTAHDRTGSTDETGSNVGPRRPRKGIDLEPAATPGRDTRPHAPTVARGDDGSSRSRFLSIWPTPHEVVEDAIDGRFGLGATWVGARCGRV
jgi:hypothetical protein